MLRRMSDRVSLAIVDGIADVRLNRPDKLNALDQAMFQAIVESGEALKADPAVRVVVLSGEGRGFCAGLDFGSFQAMAGDAAKPTAGDAGRALGAIAETGGRITHLAQQSAWVWQELEVPVIAAIHGPALGGGLQIALGADLRIVAPDAKLSVLEARWGLIPDMTGTAMLRMLVGIDVAKDLTFTGRMVAGDEAVRLGLATRVADDPRAASSCARKSACDPDPCSMSISSQSKPASAAISTAVAEPRFRNVPASTSERRRFLSIHCIERFLCR